MLEIVEIMMWAGAVASICVLAAAGFRDCASEEWLAMVDTPKMTSGKTISPGRLSGGCQMCGGSLDDPHFVPLDNFGGGRAQTIHVPVCGQCYPRLATTEGIVELTKKVNEWNGVSDVELTCDPDDFPLF